MISKNTKMKKVAICYFNTCYFVLNAILVYAVLAYAILNVLLFFGAAILSTCSIVHAIMTNAIIVPAHLSGHRSQHNVII